jgi:hypothetical protein
MSLVENLKESMSQALNPIMDKIKKKIFGPNNENLDYILDSFYKLPPEKRNLVLGAIISLIVGFVLTSVLIYFSRTASLDRELNATFLALNQIKVAKISDTLEGKNFEDLVDKVKQKTSKIRFKPFFEKLAKDQKVDMRNLSEKPMEADSSNPLHAEITEYQIEMKLPEISIPKLLSFLVEIEKSKNFFRVQDLKITGQYGNKLYFDTTLTVRGYQAK